MLTCLLADILTIKASNNLIALMNESKRNTWDVSQYYFFFFSENSNIQTSLLPLSVIYKQLKHIFLKNAKL